MYFCSWLYFFVCKITLCRAVGLYVNHSGLLQSNLPQDFLRSKAIKRLIKCFFHFALPSFSVPLPLRKYGNEIVTYLWFNLAFGRFPLLLA